MQKINWLTALLLSFLVGIAPLSACHGQATNPVQAIDDLSPTPGETGQTTNPAYTSTKVTPLPGDSVQQVSSLMVMMGLDDLINQSDTILTGRIVEINEPRWTNKHSGPRTSYMDVIIQPEGFLLGFKADKTAVRVLGGRIGATSMIVEDQPEFILGQQVLLFLSRPVNLELGPPNGFGLADYYNVTGSLQGKWAYNNGKSVDFYGAVHDLSSIEKRIAELRPGEQQPAKFVRPEQAGTPLVFFERNYLMGGREAYLSIYEDGTVILDEAIGTRMAIYGFTRCWFTGKLSAEDISELKAYMGSIGLLNLPEHYVYSATMFSDLSASIEINIDGINKKVTSMGYFADSLPDVFGDVYATLIAITYDLKFVGSEKIT